MKAFISVDFEGMPFIVSPAQLSPKGVLYNEGRKIVTQVTLTVCKALREGGFEEIIIADSHGMMTNLLVEELPEFVSVVGGFLRPCSMVTGISKVNAALFIGYHAKAGTAKSTFDHTYSGIINSLRINGIEVSEFLFNAYVAGYYKVPVIMVAGEEKLLEKDVATHAPWAVRVPLKHSFTRYSAISLSMNKINKLLRKSVQEAINRFNKGICKPLNTQTPILMEVDFINTGFADVAELLPGVKRINSRTIHYTAKDVIEAYNVLELLVLAVQGLNALISRY